MKLIKKVVASHVAKLARESRSLSTKYGQLPTYQRTVTEIADFLLSQFGNITMWDDLAELMAWAFLKWCEEHNYDVENYEVQYQGKALYAKFVANLRQTVAEKFVQRYNMDVVWDLS